MTKKIDFYFDFISPYSYIAHQKIKSIKNVNFNYKPILLGGLHNLQGITAPAFIKSKLKHMINDCSLIAKKNKFDFIWVLNNDFDIFDIIKDDSINVDDRLIRDQIFNDLRALINLLPKDQKEVLKMRYFEEMSFKKIAEYFDISINTALGRMRYAVINIRKYTGYNIEINF